MSDEAYNEIHKRDENTKKFINIVGELLNNKEYSKLIPILKYKLIEKDEQFFEKPKDYVNTITCDFIIHETLFSCYDNLNEHKKALNELEYQLDCMTVSNTIKRFENKHIELISKRFNYMKEHFEIFNNKNNLDDLICNHLTFLKNKQEFDSDEFETLLDLIDNIELHLIGLDFLSDYYKQNSKFNKTNETIKIALEISKNKNRTYDTYYFAYKILSI